jgi:hypothetical protein
MALGDLYVSVEDLRDYVQLSDPYDDDLIQAVAYACQARIESHCDRQFNDAGADNLVARVFAPTSSHIIRTDDFSTTTGLEVALDTTGTGTYGTALASTEFYVEPLNGVVAGQTGWPYKRIVMRNRCLSAGPSVEVTARWGWAAVPQPVQRALCVLTASVLDRRNSPNGIIGTGDFVFEVRRAKLDPTVLMLLQPYVKSELLIA